MKQALIIASALLICGCTDKPASEKAEASASPTATKSTSDAGASSLTARAFTELLKNRDLLLSKSPQCADELEPQRTVGDLLATYLSYPSEDPSLKFNLYTQCEETKAEKNNTVVEAYDCKLSITQEDTLGISATLMFSIDRSNFSLLIDSLRCF